MEQTSQENMTPITPNDPHLANRLVTFGESYILLSPDELVVLEQAESLRISVGGDELNTAAAYACFDLPVRWISTVADTALGRRVLRAVRVANIDTSFVHVDSGRTAIRFGDAAIPFRTRTSLLDNAETAFAKHSSGAYDWDAILADCAGFYISGNTLGASPTVRQDTIDAITYANQHGIIVGLRLTFDERIWSESTAQQIYADLIPHVDVLFTDRPNINRFFGIRGSHERVMAATRERLGVAAIAMLRERKREPDQITLEGQAMGASGLIMSSQKHVVQSVDAGGVEEAFAAGFLAGYLADPGDIGRAIRLATAACTLAHTTRGEMMIATREEIEALAAVRD